MKITNLLPMIALGVSIGSVVYGNRAFAQLIPTSPPRVSGAKDPTSGMKASLKARFGFSDAQSTTVIQRSQTIAMDYRPQFLALQKKYLANGRPVTPEQRKQFQKETIPLFAEIGKKMNTVLLAVATKEQRPRVLAQINAAKSQTKPPK